MRIPLSASKSWGKRENDMTREELLKRIVIDPAICFGKPVIRGTRIWVALILENLAEGMSETELLKAYPGLAQDDLRAALAYAAEIARERLVPLGVEVHG